MSARAEDSGAGAGLYVHEVITCRSLQSREPYQEIAKGMKGFSLLGTWQIVGMTGIWPTVLNIWQVPGGWSGWAEFLERTYGAAKREMHTYFDKFDEVRSGGSDMLMRPVPWSPSPEQLVADGVTGSLFVHEVTTVRPGAGSEYLAAMHEHWLPVANDHGHRLIGMYEVADVRHDCGDRVGHRRREPHRPDDVAGFAHRASGGHGRASSPRPGMRN